VTYQAAVFDKSATGSCGKEGCMVRKSVDFIAIRVDFIPIPVQAKIQHFAGVTVSACGRAQLWRLLFL
jgi:hypothetical protein